ncbi:hypothetical protein BDW62DRAFT_146988 [Aspergillus aurantiobrunneus]
MEEDELFRIHSILHLVFHRNRNQHGRTKWWKWLSILKRTVWSFAVSLSSGNRGDSRPAEFFKRQLADRILPRCYVAFSAVVADVQFATLGTVLLATLARLSKSTWIDKEFKSHPPIGTSQENVSLPHNNMSKGKEDIGEVLPRTEWTLDVVRRPVAQQKPRLVLGNTGSPSSQKPNAAQTLDAANPKKGKQKKKKDAIDDLFDGLL